MPPAGGSSRAAGWWGQEDQAGAARSAFQKPEPEFLLPSPNVKTLANDSKNCKLSRANQNRAEGQMQAAGCQLLDLSQTFQGLRCLLARAALRPSSQLSLGRGH